MIPGRGTLTGDLVFYGVLSPGATVLTLQTFQFETGPRETIDVASQTATDTFPKFSVDIPLDA